MKKIFTVVLLLTMIQLIIAATPSVTDFTYDFNKTIEEDTAIHYTDSIQLTIYTPEETTCYYTTVENSEPGNSFEKNFGTKHEKIIEGLTDGLQKYYIKCGNSSNPIMQVNFKTKKPIYATVDISEDSPLKAGTYDITIVTSTQTLEVPTLEYSYNGLVYKPIPLSGTGKVWSGYLIIEKNVGEVIGSFKFKGTDLDGKEGTEIQGDKVFIIDTKVPSVIQTIEAQGYVGEVELSWFLDEEVDDFNIYRSENPGVDFTDYYDTSGGDEYQDTDVTRGKTYYYKIAAVDEAGNIGQFSREVSATALLQNTTKDEGGLNPQLIGKVDNMITQIQLLEEDIRSIKSSQQEKSETEKKFMELLSITKEYDSALSELAAIKRDVERYKEQDLTSLELDKKLNSISVRLDIIKKKIPESITTISSNTIKRELSEEKITQAVLEMGQGTLTEKEIEKTVEQSYNLINEEEISIQSELYNIELIYLDGSQKEMTLIIETITAELERSHNTNILLVVPKEIAQKASELSFGNLNYEVIKEDPVLSFDADTNQITYTLNKHTDETKLEDIIITPIMKYNSEEKTSLITGYSIADTALTPQNIGGIALGIALLILVWYLLRLKNKKPDEIEIELQKAEELKKNNKLEELKKTYVDIQTKYKELNKKKKKRYFSKIKEIYET